MKKRIFRVQSLFLAMVLSLLAFLGACSVDVDNQPIEGSQQESNKEDLKVHFIDVGQADSILIENKGNTMLIDAGNNGDADLVIDYLRKNGIKRLDHVIGTHPHEDHIGGLDGVIDSFDIGKVYMPKVSHTTKTFKDVINSIKAKKLKITTPMVGSKLSIGEAEAVILAPNNREYNELNNYSIVIKVKYGDTSYLFTGDAEDDSEKEMLKKGLDLSANVLKAGHHGSHSSTSGEFLKAVNPKYAVIMCEKNNDYGHPHKEIMDKFKGRNIPVYRTDESGTIVSISDGKTIKFNVDPGSYKYPIKDNQSKEAHKENYGENNKSNTNDTKNNIAISARVDNTKPKQNSTIKLAVKGPANAKVRAVLHYKSKDTDYNGTIKDNGELTIPINIGRASAGYKVVIDVEASYKGNTYKDQTSFTPK